MDPWGIVKLKNSISSSIKLMNNLKLRQLAVFVDIYQTRKIAAAALRLNMTQSAASIALRQLEISIGALLFDRTTRSMLPTQAAFDLLPIAERMLRDARMAERMFRTESTVSARLSIAATPTIAQTLLPELLRTFLNSHPEVHVDVLDVPPSRFVMTVSSGQADIGLGYVAPDETELRQHRLLSDHLCLVAKAGRAGSRGAAPTWRTIQEIPLVLIQPGYGIREIIDSAALEAGVSLNVSQEVSLLTTALAMTRAGLTHTIAPAQFARMDIFPGLVARRIGGPIVKRDLSAVFALDRTPTPVTLKFLAHSRESLKRAASDA